MNINQVDQVPIINLNKFPYNLIGSVKAYVNHEFIPGTGWLFRPNMVMTNKHVVNNSSEIYFYIYNENNPQPDIIRVVNIYYPVSDCPTLDYAILKLDKPVERKEYFQFKPEEYEKDTEIDVCMIGGSLEMDVIYKSDTQIVKNCYRENSKCSIDECIMCKTLYSIENLNIQGRASGSVIVYSKNTAWGIHSRKIGNDTAQGIQFTQEIINDIMFQTNMMLLLENCEEVNNYLEACKEYNLSLITHNINNILAWKHTFDYLKILIETYSSNFLGNFWRHVDIFHLYYKKWKYINESYLKESLIKHIYSVLYNDAYGYAKYSEDLEVLRSCTDFRSNIIDNINEENPMKYLKNVENDLMKLAKEFSKDKMSVLGDIFFLIGNKYDIIRRVIGDETADSIKCIEHYYTKHLKVDSKSFHTYNFLGNLYAGGNDFAKALKYYEKSTKIEPKIENNIYGFYGEFRLSALIYHQAEMIPTLITKLGRLRTAIRDKPYYKKIFDEILRMIEIDGNLIR